MVQKALVAAAELEKEGISRRGDRPAHAGAARQRGRDRGSVTKTGRLLVADEDYLNFGLTGEIAALIAERLDRIALKSPVRRLGVPGVPIPYSRPLEQSVIPQVQHIADACRGIVGARLARAA